MKKRYIFLVVCSLFFLFLSVCFFQVHAQKQIKNSTLQGIVIGIDPGHGGKDMGASFEGVDEAQINLEISLKLKEKLESKGAKVYLTREDNYDLASRNAKNRKQEDLKKRVLILNQEEVDIFLSIHLNAFNNSAVSGPTVFSKLNHPSSKLLAQYIQNELNTLTKQKKVNKEGDYYILNYTDTIGVLIECGFLSNFNERNKLKESTYQYELVDSIIVGIENYFTPYSMY